MFIVLGILILLVAPAVTGIVRDRRIDRQIKQAQQRRGTSRRVARTV